MNFLAFPVAALDYHEDQEVDNTKAFWEASKQMYAEAVRAPITALIDDLDADFSPAKLFRPHGETRTSLDDPRGCRPLRVSSRPHIST